MLKGLDVSYAQGRIPQSDWAQLATNGLKFCFVKVAEGMAPKPDVQCADHVRAARSAGMIVGGYFFAHFKPGVNPEAQAELHHQFALLEGLGMPGDLAPSLDLEWPAPDQWAKNGCSAAQLRKDAIAYLNTAAELWGVTPIVYTYPDFWMHLGGGAEPAFARYTPWTASYPQGGWPDSDHKPLILRPWTQWVFWQWTGSGKLPSGSPVDYDVFNGDEADLEAFRQKDLVVETVDPAAGSTSSNA